MGVTFTKAIFASFLLLFSVVALGQVQGPAAKGGSHVRTRIEDRNVDRRIDSRRIIEHLGLDYAFLIGEFRAASKKNSRVRLYDVIRANLIATLQSSQTARETTHRLILELSENKPLNDAVINVLRLSPVDTEAAVKAATDRLAQSKRCRH